MFLPGDEIPENGAARVDTLGDFSNYPIDK
jgi:hypothetical protein